MLRQIFVEEPRGEIPAAQLDGLQRLTLAALAGGVLVLGVIPGGLVALIKGSCFEKTAFLSDRPELLSSLQYPVNMALKPLRCFPSCMGTQLGFTSSTSTRSGLKWASPHDMAGTTRIF